MGIRLPKLALVAALALCGALVSPAQCAEPDNRLFIVTSFPGTLFERFKAAFEQEHPGAKLKILNRKTSAAIAYIQEHIALRPDLFWASAPDAFEVLKESGDLEPFAAGVADIPQKIGRYPVHDPDGYYTGFAVSGYGMMWNIRYLSRHKLSPPKDWDDLTNPMYHRHLGITSPSRSGTTHVIVESILQRYGWEKGWALLMEMAGNLATVTARSFSVVDGVNSGRFGIGLVIDFLGFSSKASGLPVEFTYAASSPIVPASVALLKNAANPDLAKAFIRFLLSGSGQRLLFDPAIHRLPVVQSLYASAPGGYPNPFQGSGKLEGGTFDSTISRERYQLVNAMFDTLITFRVRTFNKVWAAIHRAESLAATSPTPAANEAIAKARALATRVPVTAQEAANPAFADVFIRKQRGRSVPERQARNEAAWNEATEQNLRDALRIAEAQSRLLEAKDHRSAGQ